MASTRDSRDRAPRVKNRAPAAVQVSDLIEIFPLNVADTPCRSRRNSCYGKLKRDKKHLSLRLDSVFRISRSFQSFKGGRGQSLKDEFDIPEIVSDVRIPYIGHIASKGV